MIEQLISENLFQFGIAGIFLAYMIYDRTTLMKQFSKSISNNTLALNKLSLIIELYHRKK